MQFLKEYSNQTFSSFKVPNFRKYFIGQLISASGTWMQNIAQGLLMLQLTGSGTALGILIALQFLPLLLFGSFAGVVIDRFPKRYVFFITQTLLAIIALLLGFFVLFGLRDVWIVYALGLALGFATAIDNPTKQSFIFELVGKEQIKNAISLNSVMINIAKVLGPAMAALFVSLFGLAACFFFNAFSFIAVLITLAFINDNELHKSMQLTKVKGELTKGLSYVLKTPMLRNVLLLMVIIGMFTYEFRVILPLFAEFTFKNPSSGYAILMSAMGAGSVVGGLYSAGKTETSMRTLIIIAFLFGLAVLATALMPNLLTATIALTVVGFLSINFNALTNALLQVHSLPEMRGRVLSLWSIAFLGTTPLGGPLIGWIGEHYGARWGLGLGGIAAMIAAIFVYTIIRREKQNKIPPHITPQEQML